MMLIVKWINRKHAIVTVFVLQMSISCPLSVDCREKESVWCNKTYSRIRHVYQAERRLMFRLINGIDIEEECIHVHSRTSFFLSLFSFCFIHHFWNKLEGQEFVHFHCFYTLNKKKRRKSKYLHKMLKQVLQFVAFDEYLIYWLIVNDRTGEKKKET